MSDGKTCDDVLFQEPGTISQLQPESIVIVMSSIPVATAKEQSQKCSQLGLQYLDSPVSGGEKGEINASLAIIVGGDEHVFSQAETVFKALGRPVFVGKS